MANVTNGNTFFIDTASGSGGAQIEEQNILVTHIVITCNGSAAQLVLRDNSASPIVKVDLRHPASVGSQAYYFDENPILFPNGIDPSTVTNLTAFVVYKRQGGGR